MLLSAVQKGGRLPGRRAPCHCLMRDTAAFFTEHHFYVKEPGTDNLRSFRLWYLEDILWKMNKMSLSFQGKLAAFGVNVKI